MRRSITVLALAAAACFAAPSPGFAVTGVLGASYGPPLAVQASASNLQGNVLGQDAVNFSDLSQLDRAYAEVAGGTLHLFFAGNLPFAWAGEGTTVERPLEIFIDCAPGGQHVLLANNPDFGGLNDTNHMAGLTFDTGFAPDYYLTCGAVNASWDNFDVYYAALPTLGGGVGRYLGSTKPGPPGALAGGTNPDNVEATLDDSNNTPLASGCGAASDLDVRTGVELAIPLSALGSPAGCIRVCAFIGTEQHLAVTNQVLGPLPPGTCSTVPMGAMDFSAIAGDQFFTVCPATPTRPGTWGSVKARYR